MGAVLVSVEARHLAQRFYGAFLAADRDALSAVVAPDAVWLVPLETPVSGAHVGPDGIAAFRGLLSRLSNGTWRPLREDSFDVAASEWHAVVMDRFVAEREERRLDSHEIVVLAIEASRIVRLFHYLHDPRGFEAFWS